MSAVAGLIAAADVRVLLGPALTRTRRLARHIWRMGLSLWIALMSGLAQPKVGGLLFQTVNLRWIPVAALVLTIAYWLVRVRRAGGRKPLKAPFIPAHGGPCREKLDAICIAVAAAALSAEPAAAAPAQSAAYKAPRTAYGAPDLQGLWTNTALTFLQRPPIFKGLIATDKEEAMMINLFKSMAGDIVSTAPVDPKLPAPPKVKEAPQSDYIEMDLHLGRINGQPRTSWIVEPADGRLPFNEATKKAARRRTKRGGLRQRRGRDTRALPRPPSVRQKARR